jgi:glycosyltransferase involved in cell wall biosynthesis
MAQKSALTSGIRIEVIHYGIDQSVYSPIRRNEARNALGISLDEKVLCFAAHDLTLPHKGGQYLSEALESIHQRKPVRLLTMGSGHFKVPQRYPHIHFGKIASDELQALIYRASDVFIIPSLEESFGQTALEAVACGTVVVGFEVGGIVDIVKNGLNGKLVERGNLAALSQAILDLLNFSELRASWKETTEVWVSERFSYKKNASKYVSLYQELMRGETG